MRRRDFITLLGGAAAAWPFAARAQQPAMPVIGFLGLGPASAWSSRVEALRAGLRDLGWVEGKNITVEFRWGDRVQQLPELAAELVRMNVDVIFAPSSTMVEPARQATKTIPIVFANHADPIGTGHVASLPRPGGNITGLSELTTELNAKALETLKEAVPQAHDEKRVDTFPRGRSQRRVEIFPVTTLQRARLAEQMTMDEARRVASNIAKLPEMLKRGNSIN